LQCLTSHSLPADYVPADDPSQIPKFVAGLLSDNVVRSDLWGFFDTNTATYSRYGYGRPPTASGSFTSTPPQGPQNVVENCEAEANSSLPGGSDSRPEFLVDIHALPGRGPEVPLTDSRWLAAQRKWATCMADNGFPGYATALDAIGDPKWQRLDSSGRPSNAGASAAEVATASADITCKQKTNLVGIGLAVQSAYDQRYIQANTDALAKFRTKIAAYIAQE